MALLLDIDSDTLEIVLRVAGALLTGGLGAASWRYYHRRSPILDDQALLKTLTHEQRLRLELGFTDTGPLEGIDPLRPTVHSAPEIRAQIQQLLAESHQREAGVVLAPADQAALRQRLDELLRAKWAVLLARLSELGGDSSGSSWATLLQGEFGIHAMVADLRQAIQETKQQPTYPALAHQLEGPLETVSKVLSHADESCAETVMPAEALRLRSAICAFTDGELRVMAANIALTAHSAAEE